MSPFLTAILENFFFRGAISLGKFYQSNRMVIGPAVDEVAEYYKLPNWIGISTSQSASSVLNMSGNHLSDVLIRYNIPYKNGMMEANGWALAWIKSDRSRFDKCMRILEWKQELLKREGNLDYVKYANTINFCHYMSQVNQ